MRKIPPGVLLQSSGVAKNVLDILRQKDDEPVGVREPRRHSSPRRKVQISGLEYPYSEWLSGLTRSSRDNACRRVRAWKRHGRDKVGKKLTCGSVRAKVKGLHYKIEELLSGEVAAYSRGVRARSGKLGVRSHAGRNVIGATLYLESALQERARVGEEVECV